MNPEFDDVLAHWDGKFLDLVLLASILTMTPRLAPNPKTSSPGPLHDGKHNVNDA